MGLFLENYKSAKYENDALEFGLAYSRLITNWVEDYLKRIEEER
jgi:hypothetical protein